MAALQTLSKLSPSERIKLQAALQSLNNNSYNRVKKTTRQVSSPMNNLSNSFGLSNNSFGANLGLLGTGANMHQSLLTGSSGSIAKASNPLASQVCNVHNFFTFNKSVQLASLTGINQTFVETTNTEDKFNLKYPTPATPVSQQNDLKSRNSVYSNSLINSHMPIIGPGNHEVEESEGAQIVVDLKKLGVDLDKDVGRSIQKNSPETDQSNLI